MRSHTFYYFLKPAIPWPLRIALRRWRAGRLRARHQESWPVQPGSECAPAGWPGWPDGRRFAFVITHDVEGVKGLRRCPALIGLEQELKVRAGYNFVPEGQYEVPAELRRRLVAAGFEVGVHDLRHDGKLYLTRRAFRRSADRINHYLKAWNSVGFRSGFMHHNLDWLQDLDLLYDASTFDTDPFEPQPDGVGTIFPFWVAGSEAGSGYIELPYTLVQDFNLFVILREQGTEVWKKKLDWIAHHGGMALLNIHPDYLADEGSAPARDEYPLSRFVEFVEWVKQAHAGEYWMALPREVAAYCHKFKPLHPGLAAAEAAMEAAVPGSDPAREHQRARV